jgi:hypothetical protein
LWRSEEADLLAEESAELPDFEMEEATEDADLERLDAVAEACLLSTPAEVADL